MQLQQSDTHQLNSELRHTPQYSQELDLLAREITTVSGSSITLITEASTEHDTFALKAYAGSAAFGEVKTLPFYALDTFPVRAAVGQGIWVTTPTGKEGMYVVESQVYLGKEKRIRIQSFFPDRPTQDQIEAFQITTGLNTVAIVEQFMTTEDNKGQIIKALLAALHERDIETARHCLIVGRLARYIGECMHLSEDELDILELNGILHDIGKLGVPTSILSKAGPLDEEEKINMRRHPRIGADMIRHIPEFEFVIEGIEDHHEHFDGSGYTEGKKGNAISKRGRIMAIVDVAAARTAERPYSKERFPLQDLKEYFKEESGRYFDPKLVGFMLSLLEKEEVVKLLYSADAIDFPEWLAK